MTSKQKNAIRRHADYLDRAALEAKLRYDKLRAQFPAYTSNPAIMPAAQACDNAARDAKNFRHYAENL